MGWQYFFKLHKGIRRFIHFVRIWFVLFHIGVVVYKIKCANIYNQEELLPRVTSPLPGGSHNLAQ